MGTRKTMGKSSEDCGRMVVFNWENHVVMADFHQGTWGKLMGFIANL